MDFARPRPVIRVLFLMRGPIEASAVTARLKGEARGASEFAFCYELSADQDGLREALEAQRALTEVLRQVFGEMAESIPIFAVSDRPGERVEDYAMAWGATVVRA
ncbi:MAG TPA: hypothetical protein VJV79_37755 [Polyangiaceae bacterium]|nr:hypothetical protein [Polyangiaceae bacterium]